MNGDLKMNKKLIFIGSDHGGLDLKNSIKKYLIKTKPDFEIIDLGTNDSSSVDYPDYGFMVAKKVKNNSDSLGILFCGTGIGISMAANRIKGIRAALVFNEFTAKMAKAHNNANILCLGGRTTSTPKAKKLINTWLDTPFEGGRHQKRIDKLDQ
jgi:ribose 5-phosphate isomerase B